jgi:hypothetical protein
MRRLRRRKYVSCGKVLDRDDFKAKAVTRKPQQSRQMPLFGAEEARI